MKQRALVVPSVKRSILPCQECRGVGYFTLQAKDRGQRSRVACPVCRGTAVRAEGACSPGFCESDSHPATAVVR